MINHGTVRVSCFQTNSFVTHNHTCIYIYRVYTYIYIYIHIHVYINIWYNMTIILYIYTSNAWGIGGIRPSLEIQPPQLYDPIPRGKNPRIWRFFYDTKGVSYYPLCADHNGIMHELRIHITNHYISIYIYIYDFSIGFWHCMTLLFRNSCGMSHKKQSKSGSTDWLDTLVL